MKKLVYAKLNSYKQGEVIQLMNNVVGVYNHYDTQTLMLSNRLQVLADAVLDFEAVFMNPLGNALTGEVNHLGKLRMKTLRVIRMTVKAQLISTNTEKALQADLLFKSFQQHCARVSRFSYQHKTAVIKAMLKDWTTESPLVRAIEVLGIGSEVENLVIQNQECDKKYFERARISSSSSGSEEKIKRIINAYLELVRDTTSFARVAVDKVPYENIIDELNEVIKQNNAPANLRAGQPKKRKSDKQKVDVKDSAISE